MKESNEIWPALDDTPFQITLDRDWWNARDILIMCNGKWNVYRSKSEIQKGKNLNLVSRLSRKFKVHSVWRLENKLNNYTTK